MSEKKQDYIAQYHALNRDDQWNSPGQGSPRYKFKARDDEEALDIALSFAEKPTSWGAGCKRRIPLGQEKYELKNLHRLNEIQLTRTSPKKRLTPCIGKDGFDFFV